MINFLSLSDVLFWAATPSGSQVGRIAKGVAKEAPKYADDVVRVVAKNTGFFESIPIWVWVVIGIVIVSIIIYWIFEN